MSSCASPSFLDSLNIKVGKETKLAYDDGDTVHFLVTSQKERNYNEFCNSIVIPRNPSETINSYTEHTNKLFTKVNLSLASDSPNLKEHGDFIQQLRGSILEKPLLDDGKFYRGVTLSEPEIAQMEKLGRFFIPSFTSTSVDMGKAYAQSAMLSITTSYCSKYACSITPELSRYYNEEKEVLLACYSAFSLQRIEVVNSKKIISLHLDEYCSGMDRI